MARLGRGDGDALGVQVVQQLGGSQTDPGRFEALLELRQHQRPVPQDLTVQPRVGQDEGAHRPQTVLVVARRLGGRDAAVAVGVGGEAQLGVGPAERTWRGFYFPYL